MLAVHKTGQLSATFCALATQTPELVIDGPDLCRLRTHGHDQRGWLSQTDADTPAYRRRVKANQIEAMPLMTRAPTTLAMDDRD
jgi:hypothetical protein